MATNPAETPTGNVGRRAFVKGAVATAIAGATLGGAYALAKPLAIIKESNAREINYIASFRVAGPAPRGIGWLPLEVIDGELHGIWDWPSRPDVNLADRLGATNLDWYRYCGHEEAPGLLAKPNEAGQLSQTYTGDNKLRYFVTEDKIALGFNPWYKPLLDQPMRVDHFKETFTPKAGQHTPSSGASGNWRSEGQTGSNIVSTMVIKVDPKFVTLTDKVKGPVADAVMKNIRDTGFVAFVSFCTHFCCIPGWKEDEKAARAAVGLPGFGDGTSWDLIFCTCHLSRYNPINLDLQKFILAEKTAEEDAGAGAGGGAGGH